MLIATVQCMSRQLQASAWCCSRWHQRSFRESHCLRPPVRH